MDSACILLYLAQFSLNWSWIDNIITGIYYTYHIYQRSHAVSINQLPCTLRYIMGVQLTANNMCQLMVSCAHREFSCLGEIGLFIIPYISGIDSNGNCKSMLEHSRLECFLPFWVDSNLIDSNCLCTVLRVALTHYLYIWCHYGVGWLSEPKLRPVNHDICVWEC